MPVLGVTGAAAEAVLDEDAGATVEVGDVAGRRTPPPVAAPAARSRRPATALSPFSSRGPAAAGDVKPGRRRARAPR